MKMETIKVSKTGYNFATPIIEYLIGHKRTGGLNYSRL